ncbi:MAG TPA: dihydrolipoamide acetyltransferase family protein [Methylomirabilota bacterium]|nr:dihydrolipoamide acetyltransferase family protein [Methylomirabilota bacterium]
MARPFLLPDLGEGLTEAEIVKVLVREGDVVPEDAPLLEVETDKAQVEIPSPLGGRVETIHVQPGETVRVGQVLVTFADAGAAAALPAAGPEAGARPMPAGTPVATPDPTRRLAPGTRTTATDGRARPVEPAGAPSGGGPVPATPSTRRLARELGVDLRSVRGSGSGGRVTDDDVRAAVGGGAALAQGRSTATPTTPAASLAERGADEERRPAKPLATVGLEPPPLPRFEQWGPVERQPLSHLRRTIAERMTLSAALIPHVSHFDRADITDLDALIRRNLEPARERGVTLTLTGFLLKAAALALGEHPTFNASLDPAAGELIVKRYVHVGVAVATERGLIVPVIRDVDRKPVLEVARELAALAQRVRKGQASLDDLRGGTFTITNLGALGGTGAIPIINYPEVAILGVARAREEAVVRDGQIVPRLLLPLSLTFDHRVADGAAGARFASAIVRRLEHPDQLLLDLEVRARSAGATAMLAPPGPPGVAGALDAQPTTKTAQVGALGAATVRNPDAFPRGSRDLGRVEAREATEAGPW